MTSKTPSPTGHRDNRNSTTGEWQVARAFWSQIPSTLSSITAERDDCDWDADGSKILEGDEVTFCGDVDTDPPELRSIEAEGNLISGLWDKNDFEKSEIDADPLIPLQNG